MRFLKNFSNENKQFKNRMSKATILLAILFFLLIIRLCNLQIFNYSSYATLATNNQLERIPIEANRGLIYDRNGVLLADNQPVFILNVASGSNKNIGRLLEDLKTIVNLTPNDIAQFKKALKQKHRLLQIPLKIKLSQEEVARFYVNQFRFPGVSIETKMIRHYPLANDTVTVLGYVGRVNKEELQEVTEENYQGSDYIFIGKVGIEKYYEDKLHGKTGSKVMEFDANGRPFRTIKIIPPVAGDNLYLTIDSRLQKAALEAFGNEHGAAVAIDPNNGEILAMVSSPTFDPNLFTNRIDSDTFKKLQFSKSKPMYNRATKSIFPFGSTIKPFIALQALDLGTITPTFKIFDPGWYKLEKSNQTIRDWQYGGHGYVDVTKAITESCSTFFYSLAIKLGIAKIDEVLEKFGFGTKTNIDIFEESSGILASPKWKMKRLGKSWYPGDTINSGIGQGDMKATPLQLANGVAAIAMKGIRYQPHLLYASESNGKKKMQDSIALPQVFFKDQNNWEIIIKAMQQVVSDPTGTAYSRFGQDLAYTVAGKTGTAQLYHHKIVNENPTPQNEENTAKHLRNHSLFIAFAPIENPKIALAIVVENTNIAPIIAREIFDSYLTK
jgi:penicillin-binding protein 2